MKFNRISRRHFLQGIGGATLSLPFLSSLFPEKLLAAFAPQKNFIGVTAMNGLFRMYGPNSVLMPPTPFEANLMDKQFNTVMGQHNLHYKPLQNMLVNGKLSSILDSSFNPILSKMNCIQGLDYIGLGWFHHTGHFGNWGIDTGNPAMASIDQVLATSKNFHKSAALFNKSVVWSASWTDHSRGYSSSARYVNPNDRVKSEIEIKTGYYDPVALWESFFGSATTNKSPLKTTLVDQMMADYKSVRLSRRLSSEDVKKLDLHLDLIQQTQAAVKSVSGICTQQKPADNITDRKLVLRAMNSVVVSLMACGLCHSFLCWADALLNPDGNDWHRWSHEGYSNDDDSIGNSTSYNNMVEQNRSYLHDICLDLANKLDAAGLLDNSLIVYMQEHNKRGHESWNIPVITFGSGGGFLKTGQYLDYRNFNIRDDQVYSRFGYPMNQFYASVLQAMDVPPSEFEALNRDRADGSGLRPFKLNSGYGVPTIHPNANYDYSMGGYYKSWNGYDMSAVLPMLKA